MHCVDIFAIAQLSCLHNGPIWRVTSRIFLSGDRIQLSAKVIIVTFTLGQSLLSLIYSSEKEFCLDYQTSLQLLSSIIHRASSVNSVAKDEISDFLTRNNHWETGLRLCRQDVSVKYIHCHRLSNH